MRTFTGRESLPRLGPTPDLCGQPTPLATALTARWAGTGTGACPPCRRRDTIRILRPAGTAPPAPSVGGWSARLPVGAAAVSRVAAGIEAGRACLSGEGEPRVSFHEVQGLQPFRRCSDEVALLLLDWV